MDAKENWDHAETVSFQAVDLRPAHRGLVHVCLANRVSITFQSGTRTAHPEIHQPSRNH